MNHEFRMANSEWDRIIETKRHNPPIRHSIFVILFLLLPASLHAASIVDSKHNLSVSGPGGLKASGEKEICIFCHTPHKASGNAPLWNHQMSSQIYTPYSSTTMKAADVGQPTGASKVCLSCHDGTVALGMVNSRRSAIPMAGGVVTMPSGASRLGTDLSDDHPVSFHYDSALASKNTQLKDPTSLDRRVHLDANGEMQCTSCHDPHNDQYGKFLVVENTESALCMMCHQQNRWTESIHRTSPANWNGQEPNPWTHTSGTTVAANGCENCHAPHQAGTKQRLLNSAIVEQNCYNCHNGNVAAKNIQREFNKPSVHPIATTGSLHDEAENSINPPRHVTCADCHNPHAVQASSPSTLHAPGSIVGVKGMTAEGTLIDPVTKESELCYRCHADSTARGPAVVTRQFPETNKRLQFATDNLSFHPVENVGKNTRVPSLISPWTISSRMTCTDCHNNEQGPGAGGTGPRGPHGSAFAPLLERELDTADFIGESPAAYALCYKCHSRDSILADQSFYAVNAASEKRGHSFHVVDAKAACTTCHDSHGVGTVPNLINFNTAYVTASSNGKLEYKTDAPGTGTGTCSLTCHGVDHVATTYAPLRLAPRIQRRPR